MKNRTLYIALTIILTVLYALPAVAQPPTLPGPGDAPVDGGLSLLIAAGVGYGAKKIKDQRKNNMANK